MKYMERGGFESKPFMRLTLLWSVIFLGGLWVTNFAMYFSRMGLDRASVVSYYLGSEADFRSPRSAAAMLETSHVHLPIFGIVLLILTHLLIFAPFKDRTKYAFISAAFGSAFLSEGSGWLVRFVDPGFAALKIASFAVFQGCLAFLLISLALFLLKGYREERRVRRGKHSSHSQN